MRIIPAYAGSTPSARGCPARRPDHPRIRGEHSRDPEGRLLKRGSSPHTRGALDDVYSILAIIRIIPAYAGSTSRSASHAPASADHPRIRGEHWSYLGWLLGGMGSSPHTRGARQRRTAISCRRRIIPAYAGSTRRRSPASAARPDHPRIRGEHTFGAVRP